MGNVVDGGCEMVLRGRSDPSQHALAIIRPTMGGARGQWHRSPWFSWSIAWTATDGPDSALGDGVAIDQEVMVHTHHTTQHMLVRLADAERVQRQERAAALGLPASGRRRRRRTAPRARRLPAVRVTRLRAPTA